MCNDNDWETGYDVHIQGLHFSCKYCEGFNGNFNYLAINDDISRGIVIRSPFIHTNTYLYLSVYDDSTLSFASTKGDYRICRLHILDNCRIEYLGLPQKYIDRLTELRDNKLFYRGDKGTIQYVDLNDLVKSSESDTPINFNPVITSENFTFEYTDLKKNPSLNQLVGCLKINGYLFSGQEFGGPFLYNESFLLIPVLKYGIWKTGFNLARIDLSNNQIHIFPVFKKMIFLESFKDDTVYYYDDIDKSRLCNYPF